MGTPYEGPTPAGLGIDESSFPNAYNADGDGAPISPTLSTDRKRRAAKIRANKHLGRSASSPQMREANASDEDKKRNKLGYQRISIACAHCRRRKIRCVLTNGETESRCQNCIRLKKECVFYAVDQQAALDGKTDTSSKGASGSGPPSVVSSSPPNEGREHSFDVGREYRPYATLTSNTQGQYQGLPLQPGSAFDQGFLAKDYNYRHDSFARPWASTSAYGSSSAPVNSDLDDTAHPAFTRFSQETNINGDFSPFPSEVSQISPMTNQRPSMEVPPRGDFMWSQPSALRSMPYSHADHLPSNDPAYHQPFLPTTRSPLLTTHFQPPILNTQVSQTQDHNSFVHTTPIASTGGDFAQTPTHYMYPPHPNPMGHVTQPHTGAYGGTWYNDQQPYTTFVEEPEEPARFHHRPD